MSYNVIAIIPLSLCCITKLQSKKATAAGNIKEGRRLGVRAVYLVIGAIVFALMMAMFLTGIMIPVQRTWLCYYEGRFIYSTAIYNHFIHVVSTCAGYNCERYGIGPGPL